MNNKDDKYLIKKVIKGDSQAFACLIDKYQNMVFTLALRMLKNNEDAEEVAQDSFLKAYQHLDSFKGNSKFSTWLYQIVYNTCISRLRKKSIPVDSIENVYSNEISDSEYKQAEYLISSKEKHESIKKALNELEPDDSFLLTLFYLEELDHKEISKITELTRDNIKVKIFRARKKLFEILKKNMGEEVYSLL
jgi:RNA polymerase sigma-70 factor (ECF subfamily)